MQFDIRNMFYNLVDNNFSYIFLLYFRYSRLFLEVMQSSLQITEFIFQSFIEIFFYCH